MEHSLIVGCGDIGRRVAREIADRGPCDGLIRSEAGSESLEAEGIRPLLCDLDHPPQEIPEARGAEVYYLCPPPPEGIRDPRIVNFMASCAMGLPRRVVYISTSGVYGNCHGAWVDEDAAVHPQTDRARRRLEAERVLQTWSEATGVETVILRVGGIYGPGRLPISRIANMTVICPDQAPYSNRIHATDLARVCVAAMSTASAGAIYNVSDGHPTSMTDYLYRVADHADLPRPPCVGLERAHEALSAGMLSFIRESRRLNTTRMHRELEIELLYPTLEEGLAACGTGARTVDKIMNTVFNE